MSDTPSIDDETEPLAAVLVALQDLTAELRVTNDGVAVESRERGKSIDALRDAIERKNESAAALRKSIKTLRQVVALVVVVVLAVGGAVVLEARHATTARDELAAATTQKADQLAAAVRTKAHDDCVRSNEVRSDILAGFILLFDAAGPSPKVDELRAAETE